MNIQKLTTLPQSNHPNGKTHTLPARTGIAVPLPQNHTITITNTHGTQVVDFWFLSPTSNPISVLSMCHTRASTLHLTPMVGDTLVSNHRQPMLEFAEDTSPGVHDTLIAACDIHRYRQLGVPEDVYHESCTDNYRAALEEIGMKVPEDTVPPDPLNLWMNIPVIPRGEGPVDGDGVRNVTARGEVVFARPVAGKGDYVRIRALVEGVIVMSACPQDILGICANNPTSVEFRVDGDE